MIERPPVRPRSRRPSFGGAARTRAWLGAALVAATLVAACTAQPDTSASGTAEPTAAESGAKSAGATPAETLAATPAATPEPPLSLASPGAIDPRTVSVSVATEVAPDAGGQITVTVTSEAAELVDELVVRWPADLGQTLFLAPFVPDPDLARDGGGNLVRPWTKWVLGPGEQGEPAGTVSLGYGPLDAGATLTIPLYVTRMAPGPVAFDLQVLAGESILTLSDGEPAELRVEVP